MPNTADALLFIVNPPTVAIASVLEDFMMVEFVNNGPVTAYLCWGGSGIPVLVLEDILEIISTVFKAPFYSNSYFYSFSKKLKND